MSGVEYLSLELDDPVIDEIDDEDADVSFVPDAGSERFATVLMATYENSLDCPELSGLRPVDEILTGYRADARTPPDWFRVESSGVDVGVLMMRSRAASSAGLTSRRRYATASLISLRP